MKGGNRFENGAETELLIATLTIPGSPHVATGERRFSPAFTMREAVEWIRAFMANPGIEVLLPTPESVDLTYR